MRVKIGPYTNWVGPYQIAEKLLFWIPKHNEKYETNQTVYKFGEWLAEDKNGRPTRLARICEWIHARKKRKVFVHVDKFDTWNMDGTLAYIILPLLKQLRDTKHGSPQTSMEDVPEHLRCPPATEENEWNDKSIHDRWDWILNEMIWAFEQLHPDNDWEEQYHSGVVDHKIVPHEYDKDGKVLSYVLKDGPNHTFKSDNDAIKIHQKRIDNGLRLFGTYLQGLWD